MKLLWEYNGQFNFPTIWSLTFFTSPAERIPNPPIDAKWYSHIKVTVNPLFRGMGLRRAKYHREVVGVIGIS